jgi:hypothetical protein
VALVFFRLPWCYHFGLASVSQDGALIVLPLADRAAIRSVPTMMKRPSLKSMSSSEASGTCAASFRADDLVADRGDGAAALGSQAERPAMDSLIPAVFGSTQASLAVVSLDWH